MLWLVMLKFALCPAAPCSSIPSSHQTAGDHLEILSVASAALPLDAVENVLPILRMQDRALEFFEFLFDAHHACALYLMLLPMTASVPDSMRITPPPEAQSQTGLECNTPKSGARTRRLIDCG